LQYSESNPLLGKNKTCFKNSKSNNHSIDTNNENLHDLTFKSNKINSKSLDDHSNNYLFNKIRPNFNSPKVNFKDKIETRIYSSDHDDNDITNINHSNPFSESDVEIMPGRI